MKKKDYWGKEQDELCEKWVEVMNDNSSDTVRIYNKLQTRIRIMVESIMFLYFSGNYSNTKTREDLIQEMIDYVFLTMHKYDHNKKGKNGWFSFLQTLVKNHFFYLYQINYRRADGKKVRKKDVLDNDRLELDNEENKDDNMFVIAPEEIEIDKNKDVIKFLLTCKTIYNQRKHSPCEVPLPIVFDIMIELFSDPIIEKSHTSEYIINRIREIKGHETYNYTKYRKVRSRLNSFYKYNRKKIDEELEKLK